MQVIMDFSCLLPLAVALFLTSSLSLIHCILHQCLCQHFCLHNFAYSHFHLMTHSSNSASLHLLSAALRTQPLPQSDLRCVVSAPPPPPPRASRRIMSSSFRSASISSFPLPPPPLSPYIPLDPYKSQSHFPLPIGPQPSTLISPCPPQLPRSPSGCCHSYNPEPLVCQSLVSFGIRCGVLNMKHASKV
jgi:hypothetical protein